MTERRTAVDFAHCLCDLSDTHCPDAEKIVSVMDNLNTHSLCSLYAAFEPAEARRLCERFEIHHTPKHGSWLNMAEIAIGALSRQCLERRIPSMEGMAAAVRSWVTQRTPRKPRCDGSSPRRTQGSDCGILYPRV